MVYSKVSVTVNFEAPIVPFDPTFSLLVTDADGLPKRAEGSTVVPANGTVTDVKVADDAAISSAKLGFKYTDAAPFPRPVVKKLRDTLSIKDINPNVTGEPEVDCTAYLQEYLEAIKAGTRGTLPAGTYDFNVPLDQLYGTGAVLEGDNKHTTWLRYTGPDLTDDEDFTFSIGRAGESTSRIIMRGIGIKSSTPLTKGYAVRIFNTTTCKADIRIDDGARNNFGGIRVKNSAYVNLLYSEVASHGPKIAISDTTECRCPNMEIYGEGNGIDPGIDAGAGVIIGGGVGGFYWNGGLLMCQWGFRVDRSLSANQNQQIFFTGNGTVDSCIDYLLKVDDDISNPIGKQLVLNSWFGSAMSGPAIDVTNWRDGKIHLGSATLASGGADGLLIRDPTVKIIGGASSQIANFTGYGINATVPVTIGTDVQPINCAAGAFGPNVTVVNRRYGTNRVMIDPSKQWTDNCTETSVTIAAGAIYRLAKFSGEVTVMDDATGSVATYRMGGLTGKIVGVPNNGVWVDATIPAGVGEARVFLDTADGEYANYAYAIENRKTVSMLVHMRLVALKDTL